MSVSLLLMGIVGPITAGILTSMVDALKYRPGGSVATSDCLQEHTKPQRSLG